MIYSHHKEDVILQNIKNLKPTKYSKFHWWRRYNNNETSIPKKSSIPDKIKAGYYEFPASFWDAQLCLMEMNKSYIENIKDYGVFISKNGIPKSRYKRLMEDYYKEEEIKLQRIIDDFTETYTLKKEQVIEIMENFSGNIQELYELFEKEYKYAFIKSWKRTF